ncbi:MAG: outer membrane lipoprotein carrier protein LolA [Desulfobacterales bacterium]|nr:outer membrane lipoprotein carrier protein LolA [Desulfobacterales bacterium]
MKYLKIIIITGCLVFVLFNPHLAGCKDNSYPLNLSQDEIIEKIENRYAAKGFSANFSQKSTIKAMDITDTAFGNLFVKAPGMMRWEYEKPDRQLIITDGKRLWIYRQADNQVMVGTAPYFFGNGKGSGFLSDMKIIREKFNIELDDKSAGKYYVLKLIPKEKTFDIFLIYLSISINTFDIVQITTYNSYNDETKIYLKNIEFKKHIDDSMFNFEIPEGADILQLDG